MADTTAPNIIVSMPIQPFTLPRKFGSVFNGRIYVGQVDTDPSIPSNQVQAYVQNESGDIIPVSQPIITNQAGFPVYGGQLVTVLTGSAYSMAVYDQNNVQAYYWPNILRYDGSQVLNILNSYTGGGYVGEVPSVAVLRTVSGLSNGDRLWLRGYYGTTPGQGFGDFVADTADTTTADNGVSVIVTGTGLRLKRKLDGNAVTPEMAGAVRGGDARAAIVAAFAAGYDVNGGDGQYRLSDKIEVPANRSLTGCSFTLDNKAYSDGAVFVNSESNVDVQIMGTSPTGLYPNSQIAVRTAEGAFGARIKVIADGVNMAAFGNNCSQCDFDVSAFNISGDPNMSEGYGLLLANSSNNNVASVIGNNISRHGLYISTGSSDNIVTVSLSNVVNKASVNINSRPNQALCENNQISGMIIDPFVGVNFFVESAGGPNTGGGIRNNKLIDLTIVCKEGVTQNAILYEATSECETAYGNGWRNVLITGVCESTTQPVIRIVNMPRFDSSGIKARVVAKSRILSIEKANSADMGTMRLRNVDILTLSNVVGVYNNVDTGLLDFTGADVITAGTAFQFSGTSQNNVVGAGKEEWQTVSGTVPANGSLVVPVTFKRPYFTARANVTISSASNSTDRCNANYFGLTATGMSVRLINGTASDQTLSAAVSVSGL
ncbi:hypothetical protein AV650_22045 [Serratia fonticola]|nr:hypothetical protein AV650_22045 [Serratia fonticola]